MTTHTFDDTGDAYNACQCRDEIKTGDALLIAAESVVGLAWAWPIAVTTAAGEFHTVDDKPDSLAVIMADSGITADQIRAAVALATERGFPVRPEFWECVARAGGWAVVERDPNPDGPQFPTLFHAELNRVWPLGDWQGTPRP